MQKLEKKEMWLSSAFRQLFIPIDRFFNWVFQSEYSPVYRSGTISGFLLAVVSGTGFYLIFFYRLAAPYESVHDIQTQVFLGSWIRTLHRYASDAAVISVVLHVFRMIAQGKTWGPRAFAWVSGVLLSIFLLISAWTGYVMVWDAHGQALAIAGAKIFDAIGIVADSIIRGFNGEVTTPLPSFFFMNLFLHIVIPLAMIFGLWIHTAKMARATWLPSRKLCGVFFAVFGLGAMLWPSPLLVKGNLLQIPDLILYDGFFQFWLPWVSDSPKGTFYVFLISFIFMIMSPIWLKPSKKNRPGKAYNDPKLCQGCSQCVKDCPYEAITMIPRPSGEGSPEVAFTTDSLCVSCGLCGASCDPFTMGIDGRRGIDLLRTARDLAKQLKDQGAHPEEQYVVIGCLNQAAVLSRLENWSGIKKNVQIISLECAGSAHPAAIEFLGRTFKHVIISACPERNCENKDGFMLLNERLTGKREPTFTKYFDPKKMSLVAAGDGEENRIFETIERLHTQDKLNSPERKSWAWTQYFKPLRAVLGGLGIVYSIFVVSHLSMKSDVESAILRLSWRLTGQFIETCQTRTQEELLKLPVHMRTPQLCDRKPVSFKLLLYVDNELKLDEVVHPGGFRHDRPIYVHHDIDLPAGLHQVRVSFLPIEKEATTATSLELTSEIMIPKREIALIYLSPDQNILSVKTSEAK